ncbi:MAG: class I SAM-dependent methyltransferase [Candidatus Peribacteraceae bacterium]
MKTTGYSLLDFAYGERLEQWGPYVLRRPDPTAAGAAPASPELWDSADAVYSGEKGKGEWVMKKPLPEHWNVAFGDLTLAARLAPYKHTGVFPEQQENWNYARAEAKKTGRALSVLNLFAYTGGATIALAKDGHFVTHTDSSKPSIGWAKENAVLNHIGADCIRWMLEDAPTFVSKEVKRGKKYDAIILDPPAYGHGPNGKTWRVERDLAPLLEQCSFLLSENPSFIILNGYAQNDTPESFRTLLAGIVHAKKSLKNFSIEASSLVLKTKTSRELETGIVARVRFHSS